MRSLALNWNSASAARALAQFDKERQRNSSVALRPPQQQPLQKCGFARARVADDRGVRAAGIEQHLTHVAPRGFLVATPVEFEIGVIGERARVAGAEFARVVKPLDVLLRQLERRQVFLHGLRHENLGELDLAGEVGAGDVKAIEFEIAET